MNFFISRAGEDAACATWIAAVLRDAGHGAKLQDDFKAGSFPDHIGRALKWADRFIAVLSPHYVEKPYTRAELDAAYARDPAEFIVPVLVETSEIPDHIQHLIRIDFVGKDDAQRKQALLERVGPAKTAPKIRTSVQKLPTVDPHVFGRDAQLEWLEEAWSNPQTNFVQIIAPGGTGKTALMTNWYRRHLEDVTVFGWSFYSQGTREKSQTSSDPFFAAALSWFGITVPATEPIFNKVDRLVDRLRQERVLLILDGIEPLQDHEGGLRDLALKGLLQELAARNAGLVLCTTRLRVSDVPDEEPRARSLDLDNLDPVDGARYLGSLGVRGPEDELRAASESYDNHALALTLLGTYLVTFCEADIRRRADIREFQVDETKPGRHARKVMVSYARMYEGRPELDILRALGYFDRPAEPAALRLVRPKIDFRQYQAALKRLYDARLILTKDPQQPIDCHPLVREHFAAEATQEGHARLYQHYKEQALQLPATIEEMTPLFYAVYHGCQAGQHQEALAGVYRARILRGDEAYLLRVLGALGINLSLLANFFATPWTQPVPALSPADQAWVIGEAGVALRTLGRLAEASASIAIAAEAYLRSGDLQNATITYANLNELYLTSGNIPAAIAAARQSADLANRGGMAFQKVASRALLAGALHQSGDTAGAIRLFTEAERLQAERQPSYPILYSRAGYRYCDLLLDQGQSEEVLRRASQTLVWVERQRWLLDIGLDHLSLARAHPSGSLEAARHLEDAVESLRQAGLDYLVLALLVRAMPRDLDEVFRIAIRSGMRLQLTDYHLISARKALADGDRTQARDHFEKAATLIRETGYHRRDPDLEKLRSLLT